ncbi:MAG: hypothetical protein B9S34_09490 [Opitutia bacterium Tous-C1TDCM]|nr:MAG: hypothetical protein B9S34_09490 [Opitutae bacterium Tous-C1TDCM]
MRLHLGHHFYGAGNLGDDFMLAGFLAALRQLAPGTRFTCAVPFERAPLAARFPEIEWLPYSAEARRAAIADCDAWVGLGGSPFQSAQSRWFIDHLIEDAAFCAAAGKPMDYLGVGVQTAAELQAPGLAALVGQARGIWTRDAAAAERLAAAAPATPVRAAADLAHLWFRANPPPPAAPGRATLVANFDYGTWPGRDACLAAVAALPPGERCWLAQEARPLPGAEIALHAALPAAERARWQLVTPEIAGAPLATVQARWPSGEMLVTARFHAALAGAWSGSRILVLATNEKLRAVACDLAVPALAPDADRATAERALADAVVPAKPLAAAAAAWSACAEFVRSAVAPGR